MPHIIKNLRKSIKDIAREIRSDNNLLHPDSLYFEPVAVVHTEDSLLTVYSMYAGSSIENTFFNIYIEEDADGRLSEFIVLFYVMDGSFATSYNLGGKQISEFTGSIYQMSLSQALTTPLPRSEECCEWVEYCVKKLRGGGGGGSATGTDPFEVEGWGGVEFPDIRDDRPWFDPGGGGGNVPASYEIVCGCPPQHPGGQSNPACNCKKPDILIISWPNEQFRNDERFVTTRNPDLEECYRLLIKCGIIDPRGINDFHGTGSPDAPLSFGADFAEKLGFEPGTQAYQDITECLNQRPQVLSTIQQLLQPGALIDPSDPNRTAEEMLHDVVEAGCGNGGGLTEGELYNIMAEKYEFIILFNIDKHPRLKCVYDMLKEFGFAGEILGAYEELEGRGLQLRILYDHNQSFIIKDEHGIERPRFPYNTDGSFCCGQSDYADTEASIEYSSQGVLVSAYSSVYWNKWFPELSPIEMCSYFIHELIHSEFHRWIAEEYQDIPLRSRHFSADNNPLWDRIVELKYEANAPSNHHALMIYFVDRIKEDLWSLNGETDPSRMDHYKYFAYDLFHTDEGLVQEGFLTQEELNQLKDLNSTVTSNTLCD